ncbi:hypothetical protein BIU88_04355 [Chlorobaculum limnaeum]|uniref:Uncharacterized protein n=1 Tax=Chlorobaculum limnaeum TaxID=274537 RepID=A0A1D8D1I3_CHLLM|nr:hypothetical protein [Chlorobaculum limnaeum]AOS85006.1 hypothetical protein BIU88_04355 [Chlorobaculum limnaeum]
MATIEQKLSWTETPLPEALKNLKNEEQEALARYLKEVIDKQTDGFDELYHAIGSIVRFIPHFIVIPLMVEHIRPQISAGVCRTMGVDQAVNYANDLPLEYFSEVSRHLDNDLMARILEKMKRNQAEKVILFELLHHRSHMLGIAEHLDRRMLEFVVKNLDLNGLPENDPTISAHKLLIEKIRDLR